MSRIYLFADEAGNFDFTRGRGASRYFILTTVMAESCASGEGLTKLRRQLAWEGAVLLPMGFHATEDRQAVRDRVFAELAGHDFRVDVTILDKPKVQPQVRSNNTYFYQLAWYLHFKHLARRLREYDELLVTVAALKTSGQRKAAHQAVRDVICQVSRTAKFETAFWPAATDACLQVADYCSWAIQRKWERGDDRSHVLIRNKIRSEFDVFCLNATTYY